MCPDLARLIRGWKDSILGGSPTAIGPAAPLAPPPVPGEASTAPPPSTAVAPEVPFGGESDTKPPLGDEGEDAEKEEEEDEEEDDDLEEQEEQDEQEEEETEYDDESEYHDTGYVMEDTEYYADGEGDEDDADGERETDDGRGDGDVTVDGEARRRLQKEVQLERAVYWNLECPTAADVDLVSDVMLRFALNIEAVLAAQEQGRNLTTEETEFGFVTLEPNRYRTLLSYLLDPPSIATYMAENCTTQQLGGPGDEGVMARNHFQWFTGEAGQEGMGHIGVNDTFGMCIDTFGGYQAYVTADGVKKAACMPPFDMSASCHAPLSGGLFWPATTTCASELAAQHFVDPTFTLQVQEIVQEAQSACSNITTQAACEQVDRSGFEGRISTVIAEMPIKALGNQPLVSISDAPEDSAPAGVSPSGQEAGDSGQEDSIATVAEEVAVAPARRITGMLRAPCTVVLVIVTLSLLS